jgi:uncharacterized membrane protein
MTIVDTTKFIGGLVLLVLGLVVLWRARKTRRFNEKKQGGVLMLAASAVFIAMGLGKLNLNF